MSQRDALEDGIDRAEIYAQIPAYAADDPERRASRMLEHDLALLECLSFAVERTRHERQGATYRVDGTTISRLVLLIRPDRLLCVRMSEW